MVKIKLKSKKPEHLANKVVKRFAWWPKTLYNPHSSMEVKVWWSTYYQLYIWLDHPYNHPNIQFLHGPHWKLEAETIAKIIIKYVPHRTTSANRKPY